MSWEEMYTAVLQNDENYDAVFFYAVKTTGIYCRPWCKSRTPKRQNIEFFATSEQARAAGYRACKRCRSDLLEYKPMLEIAAKIKELMDNVPLESTQVQEEMDKMALSSKRRVEIFKQVYGMTPHAYRNILRFTKAKILLEQSHEDILEIAYAVGFSSVSAFYVFFKERAQLSPAAYRKQAQASK